MSLKSAKEFKKKYGVTKLNSRILQSIIESQGYTFIEFNGIADSEKVQTLIELLNLEQDIQSSRCFIYQDGYHRLLFIHEELNEDERLIVLAHEEGHIWNNHLQGSNTAYEDVIQEHEANEFAHYILKDPSLVLRKRKVFIAGFVFLLILFSGIVAKLKYNSATYTNNLYLTDSGEKYHRKQCVYVKDRIDRHRMTLEEYESGEYEACSVCFPDDQAEESE